MYSPIRQDFNLDPDSFKQQAITSQQTTLDTVPVQASSHHEQRQDESSSHQSTHLHHHNLLQRQNSFGTAMSPPKGIPFTPTPNWFGTSLDSTLSLGQSPPTGSLGRNDFTGSPPSNSTNPMGYEDDKVQQQNLQHVFEKQKRRRESHNAVERRRRDNINERIQELSTLLPEQLLENAPNNSSIQNGNKTINKGTILKLSVDHIKDLQDQVSSYQDRMKELERRIEWVSGHPSSGDKDHSHEQMASPTPDSLNKHHPTRISRHERVQSLQFQQQFGNLHIANHSHS